MNLEAYKNIKHFILDLLFPAMCASCGQVGSFLCATCSSVISLSEPACFICNARKSSGSICSSCRPRAPHLTRVWWATSYDNEHMRKALIQFKYNSNQALAEALAGLIVASVKKRAQAHGVHIPPAASILAVPLHPRKKRLRGFNQSELLAIHIARDLSLPLLPPYIVARVKNTSPQAQAGRKEHRMKNMEHAFAVHPAHIKEIQNRFIILVDDIATTGSTLNEAARVLKEAGAAHVWGLVVAKG